MLASEYGEQSTILIKDPRVCVLAPLWERALSSTGYRSVYLVPIRDPIEVARAKVVPKELVTKQRKVLPLSPSVTGERT